MAYDKILSCHARLDRLIQYVCNPKKTTTPETGLILAEALNCDLETAYQEMKRTKRRWDKQDGILAYHIIHSYAPGEVTPEQAQALGVEMAARLVGDRFETVVTTHIDHAHIHCHIVFNSVSFMDGKRYRSNFKAYFGDIRGTSNDISRENGLSVIEPKGHGKHYAEWNAERTGKTTVRDLIRQDIDAAIGDAFTYQSFFTILEKRGYTVKRGPNITHTAVRPPGGDRFIRLDSLGDGYTEAAIMERLKGVRAGQQKQPEPPHIPVVTLAPGKRCTIRQGRLDHRPGQKLHGIRALYVRYLYVLGVIGPRGQRRRPIPFNVRAEVKKLNRYKEQFRLLHNYRIESADQLSMLKDALQADIDTQSAARRELYRRKRRGEDVSGEIAQITQAMRPIRWELRICRQIEANIPHVREQVEQASVERLNRENAEAVIVPLKQEDRKQFKTLAKKYGVLYVAVKKRGEDTGIIDIISNVNYATQLNAVFEAMGYPIPEKRQTQGEQAAKKARSRAPQETRSVERGNGSKQPTTPTADKPSVRSRLEALNRAAKEQKKVPTRTHEITR